MCGICGIAIKSGFVYDLKCVQKMVDALVHRGPDDSGLFIDRKARIALGHNRLSIIDLSSAGHQPMISRDGTVVIVYNGELYNFRELRKKLEGLGYQFHSVSDTEVVLNAFSEWGVSSLSRFDGMFALAVWNTLTNKLILARDPMGIKPLYYTSFADGQCFAFASEIKAFMAMPDFKPEISASAVRQFLEFGYTFGNNETILQGVYKLAPGTMMEIENGITKVPEPFFTPPPSKPKEIMTLQEGEKELYASLTKVVSQHLIADVPVGLLLSGGLDSSIIAAIAAHEKQITTISMGFADSEVDERPFARLISRHIRSDHHEVTIHPSQIIDNLEETVWYFDDLFADWGMLSTRLLYKQVRAQGIKVVLVGEGADEIFGGYPIFQDAIQMRGPMLWKLFLLYRQYAGKRYGFLFPKFCSIMNRYLKAENNDLFLAIRLFESRNQLPNNYVMKVDKASMSVSVEARTPFLDRRIVEIAFRMPTSQLTQANKNKYPLRAMAQRYKLLPDEIINRPKYGASIAASWMDESLLLRNYARHIILECDGWVDELGLRTAMTDYFDGKRNGLPFPYAISIFRNLAWRLLLLSLWSKRYLNY
ncbi:asparagine synthase (glutamine-hydrolyzing) [Desulfococcaceae bacterium HSG7]|nr:asparagine synthase (glutamine-hydrolyzing) [Desulfococcaceae bacterium HSG7]